MKAAPHIVIIGAGLIGLSCADALLSRGARVSLLEQRAGPVRGTSFANSGMIHPSQARSWAPESGLSDAEADKAARNVLALGRRSRDLLRANINRLGLTDMTARPAGCVQIFDDLEGARQQALIYEDLGVACQVIIDPEKSFALPAIIFPDDLSGNARDYGEALAEDLARRGAEFHFGPSAAKVRITEDGAAAAFGAARFQPDHVIIAAGSQTPELFRPLGLMIDIKPVKGFALDFDLPNDTAAESGIHIPSCPIMDARSRSALTVFGDRLRISGGWDLDSAGPLLERWAVIAPDLMAALQKPTEIWTGWRPVSGLGRPFISAVKDGSNLWVNAGHGHMGWTLCAGSGELMADMILGGVQDPRFIYPA